MVIVARTADGRVRLDFGMPDHPLAQLHFEAGECFGETSVIGIQPHIASALADLHLTRGYGEVELYPLRRGSHGGQGKHKQADKRDEAADAEPGKILHELRELAAGAGVVIGTLFGSLLAKYDHHEVKFDSATNWLTLTEATLVSRSSATSACNRRPSMSTSTAPR